MASREEAEAVKAKHSATLRARPSVSGVGTVRNGEQDWALEVHVNVTDAPDVSDLPTSLDGVPLRVVADGPYIGGPARMRITAESSAGPEPDTNGPTGPQ